ncbi:MAG: hypothetical protein R3E66_09110 [bacterium]
MMKTLLHICLAMLLVACGDDQTTSAPPQVTPEVDAGTDVRVEPDVAPEQPVPRFLELNMEPGKAVYATQTRLLPAVTVFDINAEPIPEALFDVTVSPADAAVAVDDRWELKTQGEVTFTACALLPGADGAAVCGSDTVIVDNTPPIVTLTSPVPGQQLDIADLPVRVQGTVEDDHGDVRVFVDGVEVPVQNGTFEAVVSPRFGVNHVEVTATDQINPNTTISGIDYLFAPTYVAAGVTKPSFDLDDALIFWLGQRFVDDGTPAVRGPDGALVTRDLVDILNLVLLNVDLNSQISNPVLSSAGSSLNIDDIDIGKPFVDGSIVQGGIELYVQINDLLVSTRGGIEISGQSVNLAGSIEATMSAIVRLDVTKPANGPVAVTVSTLELAVEDASSNFASADANAVFTLAQSALRTTLEQILLDTVEDAFIDQVPALLQETLNSLDSALQGQTFALDLGLGTPLTLNLDARMTRLQTFRRNRLEAGLSGSTSVDVPRVQTQSRGVPSMGAASAQPFFQSSRIQIAIQQVFINGLLHTLWDAGILELNVTDQLPITAQNAVISAKIQPLMRPPLEGQDATLVLQLGQLELTIEVLGRRDVYGVNIETGVDFDLVDSSLALTFADVPRLRTWVISSTDGRPLLSPDALEGLLLTQVYPQLLAALSGGLSFALPVPSLTGLANVAPALSTFEIAFGLQREVALREGWIVVDATLDGSFQIRADFGFTTSKKLCTSHPSPTSHRGFESSSAQEVRCSFIWTKTTLFSSVNRPPNLSNRKTTANSSPKK